MEFRLNVTHHYLGIPVKTASVKEQDLRTLSIYSQDEQIMEFRIPVSEQKPCTYDYLAYINVEGYKGRELCLNGRLPSAFFDQVVQTDEPCQEPVIRPELHVTAERGWINDPNGLVLKDGVWQLYSQYNPMNTEWENMSWAHWVSEDLIHWEWKDPVMYPDAYGTIYSGCGLVNERGLFGLPEDALLFFYTAAGDNNDWAKGKPFIQRLAYSLDGGKTLVKHETWQLPQIVFGNRDPKVFWHEESQAYVMPLFLDGHDFAILRSENLEDWEKTQELSFEAAWECPDLMKLPADDGTEHWVFWSADGFYFLGEFDGRTFTLTSGQKEAYGTKLPYAAQTYSGVWDRVISVAWLRTRHEGHLYTGAMAIPRELSLVKTGDDYRMKFSPVRELEEVWEPFAPLDMTNGFMSRKEPGGPFCLRIGWNGKEPGQSVLRIGEDAWNIDRNAGRITWKDQVYSLPMQEELRDMEVIADRGIVEITANHGIIYLVYETTDYQMDGTISYQGDGADVRMAKMK